MDARDGINTHRPAGKNETEPAGGGQLRLLNKLELLLKAYVRQQTKDGTCVITKLTAWEILAEAQERGVNIEAAYAPDLRRRKERV